ncbi:hypothetical protein STXM2123_3444 [Streptomyces sp. F-3]|nr:hypothetical protein STXM2123_3444 [Streptomyces sp. F-3]
MDRDRTVPVAVRSPENSVHGGAAPCAHDRVRAGKTSYASRRNRIRLRGRGLEATVPVPTGRVRNARSPGPGAVDRRGPPRPAAASGVAGHANKKQTCRPNPCSHASGRMATPDRKRPSAHTS